MENEYFKRVALQKMFERNSHPFFMYEDVLITSKSMRDCLNDHCYQSIKDSAEFILDSKKSYILIGGCGTSLNISNIMKNASNQLTKIPTFAENPLETINYPSIDLSDVIYVLISHSGKNLANLRAAEMARQCGAKTVAITDNPKAPLVSLVDKAIVGPKSTDICFPATRSFMIDLYLGLMLIGEIAREKNISDLIDEIYRLPDIVDALIQSYDEKIKSLISQWGKKDRIYSVGFGSNYGTAVEFSLKMVEIAGIPGIGYELEEFCHGPILSLTDNSGVVLFNTGKSELDRFVSVAKATIATGSKLIVVTDNVKENWPDEASIFEIPSLSEFYSPIAMILLGYLIIYYSALEIGQNPDTGHTENPKILDAINVLHPGEKM